ncbi:MAG: radical SAM protein [Myxococcota bacterium]|nr:radical SAM protein [Myxococcota bacterium]
MQQIQGQMGYTLAPHAVLTVGDHRVMISRLSRGWVLLSPGDYQSLVDFFDEHTSAKLDTESRQIAERLYRLGLALCDGKLAEHLTPSMPAFPESLLIKMTGHCNYNCDYCYDHSESRRKQDVDVARIVTTIDPILDQTGKLNITFHGGEPLLRFSAISRIVDHCAERHADKAIRFAIQTNGALLDDTTVEFLDRHDFSVGISLDGSTPDTNHHRGPKALDHFCRLLEQYPAFMEKRCGALSVISQANVRALPDFALWLQDHGIRGLSTTVLDPTGRAKDLNQSIGPQEITGLYDAWLQLVRAERITDLKIQNLLAYMDNLACFDPPNFCQKGPCGAGGEFLVLDADGSFRACDCIIHDAFILGDHKCTLEQALDAPSRRRVVDRHAWLVSHGPCADCPWIHLCGGTCAAKALGCATDENAVYPVECALNKHLYPILLEAYASEPEGALYQYYRRHSKARQRQNPVV